MMSDSTRRDGFHTLVRLLRYTGQYRSRLMLAIVSSLLVSILSVVSITMLLPIVETIFSQNRIQPDDGFLGWFLSPLYSLINYYAEDNPFQTLAVICSVFLAIAILTGVMRYVQQYMVYWLGNRVILDLQRELFDHLGAFNAAYFAKQRTGSLVSLFTVDIRAVGNSIFKVFGQILLDPFTLLFLFIWLLAIQWQLTLIYALSFPAVIFSLRYFAQKNRTAGYEAQTITAQLGGVLNEHFNHIRTVQAYGMDDHQQKKFWRESMGVFCAMMRMLKAMALSSPINQILGMIGFCVVLLLGAYFIFNPTGPADSLRPSEFIVFLVLLASVYQPTKRLERAIQEVQLGLAAADRVFEELDRDASLPMAKHPIPLESFQHQIHFNNVSFAYESNQPVLDSVEFTVSKGEQIAIVGPSGAGKTTLVNLIPRFFDPLEGNVCIDGTDLREMELQSLRRQISYVSQDVAVFGDSVWNNITCGDPRYTEEQVHQAARDAYADEFIQHLPNGYQTVFGEYGASLSGGQRQRIAIARAFLRDTPILILDEATSALDSESENHIKRSLQKLLHGRTSFVIAHRLSTILHSDRILVLDHGRAIDFGTHHELLERCELYSRLYALQFNPQSVTAPVS